MNAPANIPTVSTAERAYRHAITIHCPNGSELEMAARVEIAMIRDQAAAGVSRATDSVSAILREVSALATGAVYARHPTSTLIRIRGSLQLMLDAARILERTVRNG